MGVDVVRAILRVVFEDKDGGVIPVRTMRNSIHNAAESVIVVGHGSRRARKVRRRAACVVDGYIQQNKGGHLKSRALILLAGANESGVLVQEFVGAKLVGIFRVEVRKQRIEVIAQFRLARFNPAEQRYLPWKRT